jgi:hypothetical protein
MLTRAFSSTMSGWGACGVLIQPDLALVVTALAFVAEVSITTTVLWARLPLAARSVLALPPMHLVPADGWMPAGAAGSVPRLVLLSQPRR